MEWTKARRPVLRPWIRSAEVRGGGAVGRRYENGNTTTTVPVDGCMTPRTAAMDTFR